MTLGARPLSAVDAISARVAALSSAPARAADLATRAGAVGAARDDLATQAAALLRVAADLSLPATGSPGAARGGRPPSWPSGARCSTPPAKPVGIRSGLPWASGERHGNVFPSALQDHASGLLAF